MRLSTDKHISYFYISVNTTDKNFVGKTCPEAARDLNLEIKVVSWSGKMEDEPEVHHTKKIPLWIKAAINENHILLPQRRKPKGEIVFIIILIARFSFIPLV